MSRDLIVEKSMYPVFSQKIFYTPGSSVAKKRPSPAVFFPGPSIDKFCSLFNIRSITKVLKCESRNRHYLMKMTDFDDI